jgi:hypothetical protein
MFSVEKFNTAYKHESQETKETNVLLQELRKKEQLRAKI